MKAELKSREGYQTVSLNGDFVARVWGTVHAIDKPEGLGQWHVVIGQSCDAFLYVDEITMDGKPWTEDSKLEAKDV